MEISEHPTSSHTEGLRQARQQAHELINGDTKWVIKNIPPSSPGYYKLASETTHIQRNKNPPCTTRQSEASSPTDADADPSPSTIHTPITSSTIARASPSSVTAEATPSSTHAEDHSQSSTSNTSITSHSDNADKSDKLIDLIGDFDEDTSMGPT